MKKTIALFTLLLTSSIAIAQSFEHTLRFDESAGSPPATLDQIAWIAGHWRGTAFGGTTEEVWTPPMGKSMMGSFKLVQGEEVAFYELCSISEENGTLLLRIKHFSRDFKGWEEKDDSEEFRLIKITDTRAYFDGLTFEKTGPDQLTIYVIIDHEGETEEVPFPYTALKM